MRRSSSTSPRWRGKPPAALHLRQSGHDAFPVQPGAARPPEPASQSHRRETPAPGPEAVAVHLAELRSAVPDGFSLGYSVDWNPVEALLAGGDAWYSVVARLFPRASMEIVRAVHNGETAEARRLNARLQPVQGAFQ